MLRYQKAKLRVIEEPLVLNIYVFINVVILFSDKEVIYNLDEIYSIGTFVHISELHDSGDKIKMIISGHRRQVYFLFCSVFLIF